MGGTREALRSPRRALARPACGRRCGDRTEPVPRVGGPRGLGVLDDRGKVCSAIALVNLGRSSLIQRL